MSVGKRAVDRFNAQMQPVVDAAFAEASGKPVGEAKAILTRRWIAMAGRPIPEPLLTGIATRLSNGERVVLRSGAP